MTTRQEIVESRPWLKEMIAGNGGDIVIGGDLDGWLCGLILTNKANATIRGLYNNGQLALQKGYKGRQCKFIDFDIARPDVISVGHHITSYSEAENTRHLYHPEGIQINDLCGTAVTNRQNVRKAFSYKYPYSTCVLISWLFDIDLMKMSKWQRFLLFQADGVVNNIVNYSHSMKHWIDNLFGDYVRNVMVDGNLGNDLEKMDFNIKYRKIRANTIGKKGAEVKLDKFDEMVGQGKGSEKSRLISVNEDGMLILCDKNNAVLPLHFKKFLAAIGEEIGYPYIPDRWQCWENMRCFNFTKHMFKDSIKKNYVAQVADSNGLISLVHSNSTGKIDCTRGTEHEIAEAFGLAV